MELSCPLARFPIRSWWCSVWSSAWQMLPTPGMVKEAIGTQVWTLRKAQKDASTLDLDLGTSPLASGPVSSRAAACGQPSTQLCMNLAALLRLHH